MNDKRFWQVCLLVNYGIRGTLLCLAAIAFGVLALIGIEKTWAAGVLAFIFAILAGANLNVIPYLWQAGMEEAPETDEPPAREPNKKN